MALHLNREKVEFFFPHDIILNILKRLPLKSLARFRCVCKDWNDPLKTPFFIKHNLHLSTHHDIPSLLLIHSSHSHQYGRDYGLLDSITKTLMPLDPPSGHYYGDADITGSSNGLVCFRTHRTNLFLWNPATREVLYQHEAKRDDGFWHNIGFGFNKVLNDYKIVGITFDLRRVDLFSLSTRSWKEVKHVMLKRGVDIKGHIPDQFTVTDEAIHWIITNDYRSYTRSILSFDTSREVFTFIPFPASSSTQLWNPKLVTHDNKLALLCSNGLWVIEEVATSSCGSGQRWIYIEFNLSNGLSGFNHFTIWRNEVVFIPNPCWHGNCLWFYNLTTHKLEEFPIGDPIYSRVISAFNYVERNVFICNEN